MHLLQNASRQKGQEIPESETLLVEAPIPPAVSVEDSQPSSTPAPEATQDPSVQESDPHEPEPVVQNDYAVAIQKELLVFLQDSLLYMTEDRAIGLLAGRQKYLGPDKIKEFMREANSLKTKELGSLLRGMDFLRMWEFGETKFQRRARRAARAAA